MSLSCSMAFAWNLSAMSCGDLTVDRDAFSISASRHPESQLGSGFWPVIFVIFPRSVGVSGAAGLEIWGSSEFPPVRRTTPRQGFHECGEQEPWKQPQLDKPVTGKPSGSTPVCGAECRLPPPFLSGPGILLMLHHLGILAAPEPRHPTFFTAGTYAGTSLATLGR
jgi:hypothetical protein